MMVIKDYSIGDAHIGYKPILKLDINFQMTGPGRNDTRLGTDMIKWSMNHSTHASGGTYRTPQHLILFFISRTDLIRFETRWLK